MFELVPYDGAMLTIRRSRRHESTLEGLVAKALEPRACPRYAANLRVRSGPLEGVRAPVAGPAPAPARVP